MARVTVDEVKEIMEDSTIPEYKITPMITAAEEVITTVYADDTSIGATLLKEIERWFVAHMVASTLQRSITEEGIGDARIKFAGKFGEGLKATPYGQMVLTLDTTGKMAKSGKSVAGIYAVPMTYDTEI